MISFEVRIPGPRDTFRIVVETVSDEKPQSVDDLIIDEWLRLQAAQTEHKKRNRRSA